MNYTAVKVYTECECSKLFGLQRAKCVSASLKWLLIKKWCSSKSLLKFRLSRIKLLIKQVLVKTYSTLVRWDGETGVGGSMF